MLPHVEFLMGYLCLLISAACKVAWPCLLPVSSIVHLFIFLHIVALPHVYIVGFRSLYAPLPHYRPHLQPFILPT